MNISMNSKFEAVDGSKGFGIGPDFDDDTETCLSDDDVALL